jgi:hypothetical protein
MCFQAEIPWSTDGGYCTLNLYKRS